MKQFRFQLFKNITFTMILAFSLEQGGGRALSSFFVQQKTLNMPSTIQESKATREGEPTRKRHVKQDPAAVAVLKDQLRLRQERQRQLEESARHPIVHVAMEMAPFSKKGGLADVAGALPKELAKLGYKNIVIMPRYPAIEEKYPLKYTGIQFVVPVGNEFIPIKVKTTEIDGVTVYFLENGIHFPEPYTQKGKKSLEESVLLSRGALELIRRLGIQPSVIHSHDWQTALVPIYQRTLYAEYFKDTLAHFTIHNALYQGEFESEFFSLTGLPEWVYSIHGVEFWKHMNLMKGAVLFADTVNTVSPTYREETLRRNAFGFEGVLARKENWYQGILNGIDTKSWNPATDPALTHRYTSETVAEVRPLNKKALQQEAGLDIDPEVPLFAFIGRLFGEKGVDLLIQTAQQLLKGRSSIQLVVLGTGDPRLEAAIRRLAKRYPGRVAAMLTFDEPLSRRIYAGADFLVAPSRFEPCGLVQMYAMHYGAVPIVRETGGLADSVEDIHFDPSHGTGIKFLEPTKDDLLPALQDALELYQDPTKMQKVIQNGMKKNLSWEDGTIQYLEMYRAGRRQMHQADIPDLTRDPVVIDPGFEGRMERAFGLSPNSVSGETFREFYRRSWRGSRMENPQQSRQKEKKFAEALIFLLDRDGEKRKAGAKLVAELLANPSYQTTRVHSYVDNMLKTLTEVETYQNLVNIGFGFLGISEFVSEEEREVLYEINRLEKNGTLISLPDQQEDLIVSLRQMFQELIDRALVELLSPNSQRRQRAFEILYHLVEYQPGDNQGYFRRDFYSAYSLRQEGSHRISEISDRVKWLVAERYGQDPAAYQRILAAIGRKRGIAQYAYHYSREGLQESVREEGLTRKYSLAPVTGEDRNIAAVFFVNHVESGAAVADTLLGRMLLRVPLWAVKPRHDVTNEHGDGAATYSGDNIPPSAIEVVDPLDPSRGIPLIDFRREPIPVPAHWEEQLDLVKRFDLVKRTMDRKLVPETQAKGEVFDLRQRIQSGKYSLSYLHEHHPNLNRLNAQQQKRYYLLMDYLIHREKDSLKPLDKTSLMQFVREIETYTKMDLYVRISEGMLLSGTETLEGLLQSSEPAVQPLVRYLKFLKQEINEETADQKQIEAAVLGAI